MSKIVSLEKVRCPWAGADSRMLAYHDKEWGRPVHDDRRFFEFLILEGAQAGLSWQTVLNKRGAYQKAFFQFDPRKVARFTAQDQRRLLGNPGIIRNRLKIASTAQNAKAFLKIQEEFRSFDRYIWQFVNGHPKINRPRSLKDVPPKSPQSDLMSADLRLRGFNFVGSTICYAFMQATGLVNDHLSTCFVSRSRG